ncbi:hypothetical protein E2C01_037480 [Portunus trituberculatus]|uniref:Uncharacterized protein n=1 Tax=Portunus trituberculatus TaxID=210409 RepID=A0A5B7FEQ5_PORTR|nr:hypothetical protein [Portunus trituberculatus]
MTVLFTYLISPEFSASNPPHLLERGLLWLSKRQRYSHRSRVEHFFLVFSTQVLETVGGSRDDKCMLHSCVHECLDNAAVPVQ